MQGLELRHLDALVAVVDTGTFARAASRLGYSQAAVSQQIAALERTLGVVLFDRPGGPKPVRLTAAGRLVHEHARLMLDGRSALARSMEDFKEGRAGRIDVGVFQSVAVEVLPKVVARLRAEVGPVDVRPVDVRDPAELLQLLETGALDVCFTCITTMDPDAAPGATHIALVDDPYVVLTPRDHRAGDSFPVAWLVEEPLIGQPSGDMCQRLVDMMLAANAIEPDYVFRTADNAAVQSMVRAGMGVAVVPQLTVDLEDSGVRVLPLDPPMAPRTIGLAVGTNPAPLTSRFVDAARAVCSEMVRS